jgi:UDP-glucose 4-epimerase
MRAVITGGSGFIGTNLAQHLARTEPQTDVTLFDVAPPRHLLRGRCSYVYGDIRDLACLLDALDGADEVYNLAGVLGTSELLSITSLALGTNICGAGNVLEAARRCGVKRVYNVAKPHFDSTHENTYTVTKHAAEELGLMYRERFGMRVATVRWLNAVGPYQHLYPVRKFVPTMVLFALHGIPLEIYGSGEQTIDPIDVDDLSRFTVHACRRMSGDAGVVDLGSGVAVSCNDAVEAIRRVVQEECGPGVIPPVVHIPMRDGEKEGVNLVADMTYWLAAGMRTEVSFEESVRKVVAYIEGLPMHERINALRFYGKEPPTTEGLSEENNPVGVAA